MRHEYYRNKRIKTVYKITYSFSGENLTGMYYLRSREDWKRTGRIWSKYPCRSIEDYIINNQEFKYTRDDFEELTQKEINDIINKRKLIEKLIK